MNRYDVIPLPFVCLGKVMLGSSGYSVSFLFKRVVAFWSNSVVLFVELSISTNYKVHQMCFRYFISTYITCTEYFGYLLI